MVGIGRVKGRLRRLACNRGLNGPPGSGWTLSLCRDNRRRQQDRGSKYTCDYIVHHAISCRGAWLAVGVCGSRCCSACHQFAHSLHGSEKSRRQVSENYIYIMGPRNEIRRRFHGPRSWPAVAWVCRCASAVAVRSRVRSRRRLRARRARSSPMPRTARSPARPTRSTVAVPTGARSGSRRGPSG